MNLAIFHSLCRVFYGVDDLHVTRAHAKIARQRFANLSVARIGICLEERVTRHDHARRAVTALKGVIFHECFLHRIELAVFGQAFDRRHFASVRLHGKMETGFHHFAVEQHRARAALADHAADVRAGKTDILAQKMREQNTRLDVFFIKPAVNSDSDSLFHKIEEYRLRKNGSR